jgi:hypothetical protein
MSDVNIVPVTDRQGLRAFVDLPWTIYRDDRNWVPPIRSEQARLLSPGRHPFWATAERKLFLARLGEEIVGRIAVIVDHAYNRYHHERMVAWGFFESVRDPDVAAGLFSAAERWARDRDMAFLRGPLNPSTNYEVGTLVHGFDRRPCLMMAYNPPYYPELIHQCGFRREKDLVAFLFRRGTRLPAWTLDLAARLSQDPAFHVRKGDVRRLEQDLRIMNDVYNECWARNWGFVPMSGEEIREHARSLRRVIDPDFAVFVYHRDAPVAVALLLPDVNPLLQRFDGRLGLGALIKSVLHRSEVTGLRGILFGIKDDYRQMGLPWMVLRNVMESADRKSYVQYAELGWTLEDNDAINLLFREAGLEATKRYRIYRKDLQ